MGTSEGKGKKEDKIDQNEQNKEISKERNKENYEKNNRSEDSESEEKSDENLENNQKDSNKDNREQEKQINPLITEDSNNEENSNKEIKSKNRDFLQEGGKKNEKSDNISELDLAKKKEKKEKDIKTKIEYKDVLPGEIPEERKVSNPYKLSLNYNCCQTLELAHKMEITTLAYILRRNEIATGSVDKTIKLWKINTEKSKIYLSKDLNGHRGCILCIKDFPKLNCFCSGSSDYTLKLWNCSSLKCINTLVYHTKCVLSCCYNPSRKQEIFSGSEDLLIVVWTTKKEKELQNYEKNFILKGHKKRISALAYADDYDYLISGSDDKTLRIWEMKNYNDIKCIKEIKDLMSPIDYLLYLDNRLIASCEDGVISFIKMNKMKRCRSVKFSNSPVYSINIFHNHKYLLVGSEDGKTRIWKIGTNKRGLLIGHSKAVTGVMDFEKDFIITSSIDCSIKLWKMQ